MFRDTYFSLLFLFFIRHIILDFLYFDSSHLVFLTYCSTYPLLKNKIYAYKSLKLSDRQWVCPNCGEVIDRDYNAACNIKDEGLRIIGLSSAEFTLVDCPTMDDKREISLKSSDRLKQERNELHGYFL